METLYYDHPPQYIYIKEALTELRPVALTFLVMKVIKHPHSSRCSVVSTPGGSITPPGESAEQDSENTGP